MPATDANISTETDEEREQTTLGHERRERRLKLERRRQCGEIENDVANHLASFFVYRNYKVLSDILESKAVSFKAIEFVWKNRACRVPVVSILSQLLCHRTETNTNHSSRVVTHRMLCSLSSMV